MATLRVWKAFELVGGTRPASGGSLSQPTELTVDGLVDDDVIQLATASQVTLWNSGEAITNFDYFYIESDKDLKLELTIDRGAEVGSEEVVLLLEADTPFDLIYDDALANYSGTLSGGTADVIDEIVVRNESGSTATIRRTFIT